MVKIPEEQNKDNLENKIQIFSNTDKKLKSLGKMLNNDASRKILQLLIEKEMTANEIATQTKLSLPLALYHINQMIKAGIVVISKTSTNGKNQPMKYYSAKPGIIILPEKASQKAKESKSFSNSLKRIMKFASVGFAGITSWFLIRHVHTLVNYDENVVEFPFTEDTPKGVFDWFYIHYDVWIPIAVIATTTLLAFIITRKFKTNSVKK